MRTNLRVVKATRASKWKSGVMWMIFLRTLSEAPKAEQARKTRWIRRMRGGKTAASPLTGSKGHGCRTAGHGTRPQARSMGGSVQARMAGPRHPGRARRPGSGTYEAARGRKCSQTMDAELRAQGAAVSGDCGVGAGRAGGGSGPAFAAFFGREKCFFLNNEALRMLPGGSEEDSMRERRGLGKGLLRAGAALRERRSGARWAF